ncbi:MAG: VCBS repeat-containing protein, partial [Planctomycetes bacterium]|nr:VCBS repeat-containing protein [Planctomycetota bacterium]
IASSLIGFLIVEDIDGDGRHELVTGEAFGFQIRVFEQTTGFEFSPLPTPLGDASMLLFPTSAVSVDVDHDSDRDLVVSNAFGLTVFFQLAPGHFDPEPLLIPTGTSYLRALLAADLDADGDDDIVGASPDDLRIRWGGK